MLTALSINNFALIKNAHVELSHGLNIITGETGAGKSILLGALGLILGNRADSKVLLNNNGKCTIEGSFDITQLGLAAFFEENDLDYEDETIVRREINNAGRSRCFVNDTPVNLATLKDLGTRLIDIHSQHSNLLIKSPSFQYRLLDSFSDCTGLYEQYQFALGYWKTQMARYDQLREKGSQLDRDKDYIAFQLGELEEANLKEGEYEANEQELALLENAERIAENLGAMAYALSGTENSVIDQLSNGSKGLSTLSKIDQELASMADRISSSLIDLKDIDTEIARYLDNLSFDEARVEQLNERQALLQRLMQKHQTSSSEELLEVQNELQRQQSHFENISEELLEAKEAADTARQEATELADRLYQKRHKNVAPLAETLSIKLQELGIPEACIRISLNQSEGQELTSFGTDKMTLLFSANKGIEPDRVDKVASGGEISRLMLVIKAVFADKLSFPTLIFDEIDLGISGEIAIRMGLIIKELSRKHQVVSITHLPQVAAMAQTHFKVSKTLDGERSFSQISSLKKEERVAELSQMIAGTSASSATIKSAEELLAQYSN